MKYSLRITTHQKVPISLSSPTFSGQSIIFKLSSDWYLAIVGALNKGIFLFLWILWIGERQHNLTVELLEKILLKHLEFKSSFCLVMSPLKDNLFEALWGFWGNVQLWGEMLSLPLGPTRAHFSTRCSSWIALLPDAVIRYFGEGNFKA